ncbi:uncharacterized protein TNCV_2292971 [Trichonephila clavipes]|nr:uncharacterized protein TNCV_2292971 [Trichonephila clavipes]
MQITCAYACGDDQSIGPIRRSSTHFDGPLLCGRYFSVSCTAFAIKSPKFHLLTDNARSHTERLSQQSIQGYGVLYYPTMSLRLSPIENVGDMLERQPSRINGELTARLKRLWHDLREEVIGDLIDSMLRPVLACMADRDVFITY